MGKIMRYDVDYSSAAIAGVTGVKGGAESVYRRGNVDLTPENIGALAVGGDSADNTVSFETEDDLEPEEWTDVATLGSGETLKSIIGKISTMFKNIRYLKKTLVTLNTDMPVFGPFRYVTLPYTAKRNCFMQVCFTCNSTTSYLYLTSKKFGYPYWSWCSYESQHDMGISQIFPVCAGDTISVYLTGNVNPRFKVSDVI